MNPGRPSITRLIFLSINMIWFPKTRPLGRGSFLPNDRLHKNSYTPNFEGGCAESWQFPGDA